MSVRLRAGARAVLRREGLVRALDAAARTQVVEKKEAIEIHCHGENGFGMYNHNAEERPHDEKCPYKDSFGSCYTSLDKCSAKGKNVGENLDRLVKNLEEKIWVTSETH